MNRSATTALNVRSRGRRYPAHGAREDPHGRGRPSSSLTATVAPSSAAPCPRAADGLRCRARACEVFPADNVWNMDVSRLPKHPKSRQWKRSSHAGSTDLHPDFGPPSYGIPFDVVDAAHPT